MTEQEKIELNHWEQLGYDVAETENVTIVHKTLSVRDANGYENAKAELRSELHTRGVDIEKEVSFFGLEGFSDSSGRLLGFIDGRGEMYALWTTHTDTVVPSTAPSASEKPSFPFTVTRQSDDKSVMSVSHIKKSTAEPMRNFMERLVGMAQKGLEYMGKGSHVALSGTQGMALEFTKSFE